MSYTIILGIIVVSIGPLKLNEALISCIDLVVGSIAPLNSIHPPMKLLENVI